MGLRGGELEGAPVRYALQRLDPTNTKRAARAASDQEGRTEPAIGKPCGPMATIVALVCRTAGSSAAALATRVGAHAAGAAFVVAVTLPRRRRKKGHQHLGVLLTPDH